MPVVSLQKNATLPRGIKRVALFWLVACPLLCARAADLMAYTEEWPPYHYSENQQNKGISTDLLQAMCARAKLSCEVQEVPWARAYKTVLETPNSILYTTARTAAREHLFIWLGPILPRTTWVYATTEKAPSIHALSDIASARIGVVRAEATLTDLLAAGIPTTSILQLNTTQDEMRLMKLGKIDVVINTEIGMAWSLNKYGLPSTSVRKLMKLSDNSGLYFALNRNSDQAFIDTLQASIDGLIREGKIAAIAQRYTGQNNP